MGGKNSKNDDFRKIGQQANQDEPDSFMGSTQINLTSN